MNIMIRDPYYLAKTVLGSYNLYILKDPFESWHYSCVGTFNTKDEAIDYYHKLKEEEKMISRMHMKLIITEYKDYAQAHQAMKDVQKILDNGGRLVYSPKGSAGINKHEYVKIEMI